MYGLKQPAYAIIFAELFAVRGKPSLLSYFIETDIAKQILLQISHLHSLVIIPGLRLLEFWLHIYPEAFGCTLSFYVTNPIVFAEQCYKNRSLFQVFELPQEEQMSEVLKNCYLFLGVGAIAGIAIFLQVVLFFVNYSQRYSIMIASTYMYIHGQYSECDLDFSMLCLITLELV